MRKIMNLRLFERISKLRKPLFGENFEFTAFLNGFRGVESRFLKKISNLRLFERSSTLSNTTPLLKLPNNIPPPSFTTSHWIKQMILNLFLRSLAFQSFL